jgi:hypothetical protein
MPRLRLEHELQERRSWLTRLEYLEGSVCVIRICVDVCSDATRLRAEVRAESLERALSLVAARYPSSEVKVVFPIEPETFFVDGAACVSEVLRLEAPEGAVNESSSAQRA